jgi:ribonuclease P/MRP protein subunit RPP40
MRVTTVVFSHVLAFLGTLSAPAFATSGVVQGSVLGPLLFAIFVDDLPNCILTHSWLYYEDDLKLVGLASTLSSAPVHKVISTTSRHGLTAICCPCASLRVSVCTWALPTASKCTHLKALHVRGISSKASRTMDLMWRVFSSCEPTFLLRLFKTYIRPVMGYALSSWNTFRLGLVRDLEAIQRRFNKSLGGLGSHTYKARLRHLSLQSLEARRLQADLLLVRKFSSGQTDVSPARVVITVSKDSTRGTGINLFVSRAINSTTVPSLFHILIDLLFATQSQTDTR